MLYAYVKDHGASGVALGFSLDELGELRHLRFRESCGILDGKSRNGFIGIRLWESMDVLIRGD